MKNIILSNIILFARKSTDAVNGQANPFVNLINWLIDWFVLIVVPAGVLGAVVNSIVWALLGAEYKSTAKKVYIGIVIAVVIGVGAKAIAIIYESAIKSNSF